jgi:hypothetical protein
MHFLFWSRREGSPLCDEPRSGAIAIAQAASLGVCHESNLSREAAAYSAAASWLDLHCDVVPRAYALGYGYCTASRFVLQQLGFVFFVTTRFVDQRTSIQLDSLLVFVVSFTHSRIMDSTYVSQLGVETPLAHEPARHSAIVRVTHWVSAASLATQRHEYTLNL